MRRGFLGLVHMIRPLWSGDSVILSNFFLNFFRNRGKMQFTFQSRDSGEASYLWVLAQNHKEQHPRKARAIRATCWQLSGWIKKVCSNKSWDWQQIKPHPPQKTLSLGVEEISFLCPDVGILELATRIILAKHLLLENVWLFAWLLICSYLLL